ncbi:hypothetical protein VHEMI03182 [[Torrubiella] hemipterigena]|uniref:Uncharacterized protein n=2 Tax=[Torrubiella] hemipterigena TaxID=1531966 RepID=A0A0A1TAH7_9HYPO|nr:hypothetical protein VHEMI03182 [[Torrubiella] hemipterigena]
MEALLTNRTALKALYASNALWHFSAFYYFCFKQRGIMQKFSLRSHSPDAAIRSLARGDAWHHDVMAYLGAMNFPLFLFAAIRFWSILKKRTRGLLSTGSEDGDRPIDFTSLVVLGTGNSSQAVLNFATALTSQRWIMGRGFDIITVLDATLTVLDWAAAWGIYKQAQASEADSKKN